MPECLRKCSVQKIRRIPVQFPSQVSDRAKESRGFSAAHRDMQSAPLEVVDGQKGDPSKVDTARSPGMRRNFADIDLADFKKPYGT